MHRRWTLWVWGRASAKPKFPTFITAEAGRHSSRLRITLNCFHSTGGFSRSSNFTFPMNDILNESTVLVLNRPWQAIHLKTPAEAFCMIATGAATALDVWGDDYITLVHWDDWLKLPVREHDNAVNTPRGPVRVPTVIVAANYAKVPMRRPRFAARGI